MSKGLDKMAKMYFPQYSKGRKDGIKLSVGSSMLDHIKKIGGIEIESECGGNGICGRDIVRVDEGAESLTELSKIEKRFIKQGKLEQGHQLACQAIAARDNNDILFESKLFY